MNINTQQPLVAIYCLVYNHEPYLRDCFEGFLMQQTNFPFVVIVHDDASTDNSASIIREYDTKYLQIFKPIYEKENQYSKHNGCVEKIMYDAILASGAKYVAMCDGDDYWTDPLKLQKQVDFLEQNTNYVLCCHRYNVICELDGTYENDDAESLFKQNVNGISFANKENFEIWLTKTVTMLFRAEKIHDFPYWEYNNWRDTHIVYHLLKCGIGFCMPFYGAIYRRQSGGIYSSLSSVEKSKINLLIKGDLYRKNSEDKVLYEDICRVHNTYLESIRNGLYRRNESIKLNDILLVLQYGYNLSGSKGFLFCIKRILQTIYYMLRDF